MKNSLLAIFLGAWAAAVPALAQTQVDLRTQAKQVDFSGASRTKPFKTGTALPVTCSIGEAFFKTDAAAGQNLFGCTATNTWTLQSSPILTGGSGTGGAANYAATFSGLTTVTIPGATHRLASGNLLVSCYDTSTPARQVEPDSVMIASGAFDVTINFAVPQSGICVLNGSSGAGSVAGDAATGVSASIRTLDVTRTSNSILTIGSQCSLQAPCNVRFGSTVYGITASATAALNGGTGAALIYIAPDGLLTVGHNLNLSCAACRALGSTTAFPTDSLPLYTWTATNGVWDLAGGTDRRAFLSNQVISAGPGVLLSGSGSTTAVSVDTALVPTFATAAAAIDFPSIAAGACSSDVALSVPGAVVGDAVAMGWPASLPSGVTGAMRVTAADTVAVRLCNMDGTPLDPAPATYRATVVRSF